MESPTMTRRVRLLGGEVDLVAPAEMLRFVDLMVHTGGPAVIANHNAHSLFLMRRCPQLRAFFEEADLIQIDSAPLIAWGRLLGLPLKRGLRSTYLDWREDFWRLANERRWRVFHLGGEPGPADRAGRRIAERWPDVALGWRHGCFDHAPKSPENRRVLAKIAAFDPDILFVGMGAPRQEAWVWNNRAALTRGVIFTVGPAFDHEAGLEAPTGASLTNVERPPRRAKAEGLAARYLVEPWSLLGPALEDLSAAVARAALR